MKKVFSLSFDTKTDHFEIGSSLRQDLIAMKNFIIFNEDDTDEVLFEKLKAQFSTFVFLRYFENDLTTTYYNE